GAVRFLHSFPTRRSSDLRVLRATGVTAPLFAVVTEAGLIAVSADWGIDDLLLSGAGPAEVEARLRLAAGRLASAGGEDPGVIRRSEEHTSELQSRENLVC